MNYYLRLRSGLMSSMAKCVTNALVSSVGESLLDSSAVVWHACSTIASTAGLLLILCQVDKTTDHYTNNKDTKILTSPQFVCHLYYTLEFCNFARYNWSCICVFYISSHDSCFTSSLIILNTYIHSFSVSCLPGAVAIIIIIRNCHYLFCD